MRRLGSNWILVGLMLLLVSLPQCVYEDLPTPEVTVPDSVFFTADLVPIFDANCNDAGCHNTGGIPPDLTPDNAWVNLVFFQYVDTTNVEGSRLLEELIDGSMQQYANDQDIALITKWIEQGAQNN